MHRVCNLLMLRCLATSGELASEWLDPARSVWCVTARDDQTDTTPGALGKVDRKSVVFVAVLEAWSHMRCA